jgi:hypothetical protein
MDIRDGKLAKERDPQRLLERVEAAQAMRAVVFGAPVVELEAEGKSKGAARVHLLAARVFAPAGEAVLRLSVNGAVAVALNGEVVHEEEGDQYLLVDHRSVPVVLREGWNTFAIRAEKVGTYAVKFAMRLRGRDGRPLSGVAWDIPAEGLSGDAPQATKDPCAPLAVSFSREVTEGGWKVGARVEARGLLPWPPPKWVALTDGTDGVDPKGTATLPPRESPASRTQAAVSGGSLGAAVAVGAAGAGGTDSVAFDPDVSETHMSREIPAGASAAVALEVDGVKCEVLEPPGREAERRRWLALRDAVAGLDGARLGPGEADSFAFLLEDTHRQISEVGKGSPKALEAGLAGFERVIATARAGKPPFGGPGLHVRAYRSEYDGTLQRYVVLLPRSIGREAPHPLVVLAHGLAYTPEDMMRIALGKPSGPGEARRSGVIWKWDAPEPPDDAILVAHDGYGNAGQRPPGEMDVRRVIAEMRAAYRVDRLKISIAGFSLGGSVAFWVPFHSPSLFSGAGPLCGYPNLHEYGSVRGAKKRAWEPRLLDEEGVVAYAEGGRYLRLWMVHGSADNPKRSELIHARYKALDYHSELEILQAGHNIWDETFAEDRLLRSLVRAQRPEVAPKPVVSAGRYRWAENFWLRIDRFEDEGRFGQLSGAIQKKQDRVEVATKAVSGFSLLGGELGGRAEEPQEIVIDGQRLGKHVVGVELAWVKGADGWKKAGEPRAAGKRAGVEGPLGDVWFGPALVVYGTAIVSEIEVNRLAAERHRMYSPWVDLRLPVKADTEVTEADLVGRSLVLIGRPATNRLTARVAEALEAAGIVFEADAIRVGGQRFDGADVGISVIRPSPFDPERYVVVHAGVGPEGTLSSRYLPEISPDFLVYDGRIRAVFGDRILGKREVLAGGFFDADWKLEPELVGRGGR